jgi:hypothetical protein
MFISYSKELKIMKKLLLAAVALMMVMATTPAFAQKAVVRLGGGIITDGTQPGGGIGLDITRSDNPVAFGFTGEYFTKSGVTTIPISVLGMYRKANSSGKMAVFFGGGGGYALTKVKIAGISVSANKPLASGIGGAVFNVSPKVGIFVKGQYYRIFSVNFNYFSVGGGIAINIGAE